MGTTSGSGLLRRPPAVRLTREGTPGQPVVSLHVSPQGQTPLKSVDKQSLACRGAPLPQDGERTRVTADTSDVCDIHGLHTAAGPPRAEHITPNFLQGSSGKFSCICIEKRTSNPKNIFK